MDKDARNAQPARTCAEANLSWRGGADVTSPIYVWNMKIWIIPRNPQPLRFWTWRLPRDEFSERTGISGPLIPLVWFVRKVP